MLALLIGLLGGIAAAVQGPVVSSIGQRVGITAGTFLSLVSATVIAGVLLLARRGEEIGNWRSLPLYTLISGAFGLVVVLSISYTTPRLGAGSAVVLLIVTQLIAAMLIDHFGLLGVDVRQIDLTRVVAAILLLIGAYLMVR